MRLWDVHQGSCCVQTAAVSTAEARPFGPSSSGLPGVTVWPCQPSLAMLTGCTLSWAPWGLAELSLASPCGQPCFSPPSQTSIRHPHPACHTSPLPSALHLYPLRNHPPRPTCWLVLSPSQLLLSRSPGAPCSPLSHLPPPTRSSSTVALCFPPGPRDLCLVGHNSLYCIWGHW